MTSTSGIFFSYSSQNDIDFLSDNLYSTKLDRIILAVGGNISIPHEFEKPGNSRLEFIMEERRLGKSESFNRTIRMVNTDITFLVSGDVRFDPSIFEKITARFQENTGMIIPRVVAGGPGNVAGRIGRLMWNLHDTFMDFMEKGGMFFCGGEFQAIRGAQKIDFENVVNDDEFLCHQAFSSGRKIEYARDLVINNRVPGTLKKLMMQRIRVNFGHLQFTGEKRENSSMSLMGFSLLGTMASILLLHFRRFRMDLFILPIAAVFEFVSLIIAKKDFRKGVKHSIWSIVPDAGSDR